MIKYEDIRETRLRDTLKGVGDNSVYIWVSKNGNDTNGTGSFLAPYATVTKAMAIVTTIRKIIVLMPGSYVEAAAVAWPTINGVGLIGLCGADVTIVSNAVAAASIFTVTPGVQTSTWQGYISGVGIDHSLKSGGTTTAQKGITFDNTAMNKKLLFQINKCLFSSAASTDISVNVATHGDTSQAIRITIIGDCNQAEIEGAIYFKAGNWADRLLLDHVWIEGIITTSTDSPELRIRLFRCIVPTTATAGGTSAQIITCVNSYVWTDFSDLTAETYTAVATGNLAGSHTEVIVN